MPGRNGVRVQSRMVWVEQSIKKSVKIVNNAGETIVIGKVADLKRCTTQPDTGNYQVGDRIQNRKRVLLITGGEID